MTNVFPYVLLDVAMIMVLARLFGRIARMCRQPAVIGEIVAGIALGPTLLDLLPHHVETYVFPSAVLPYLGILGQLGLVLFMFIVGLELDFSLIRGRQGAAGMISILSIVAPFALGALLTFDLYPLHNVVHGRAVPMVGLALFMGVAMSITAFPVLARILLERKMNRTPVGVLALSAAAVDDILAWTLLALVTAVLKGGSALSAVRTMALTLTFAAGLVVVLKPLLARMINRHKRTGRITPDMLAVILAGLLLSAFITERIGIHEIFGAFLFGAIMPHKGAQALRRDILERLEQISVLLLLPIFFVTIGFGVNLRLFKDSGLLWQLLLILAVAVGGKFCGAFAGARIQRMSFQHSAAIAVLMNTRGLTELVILTVGQQVGVLDNSMFTMMVVMALITTVMTEPLLRRIYPDDAVQRDVDAAMKAAPATGQSYPVLVMVDDVLNALTARMIRVAEDALADRPAGGILLAQYLDAADDSTPLELGANAVLDIARMTDAAEALETFAAQTTATATPLRVLCRFGSPSARELERQIAASGAEVVVLSEDWMRSHPAAYGALDEVTIKVVG